MELRYREGINLKAEEGSINFAFESKLKSLELPSQFSNDLISEQVDKFRNLEVYRGYYPFPKANLLNFFFTPNLLFEMLSYLDVKYDPPAIRTWFHSSKSYRQFFPKLTHLRLYDLFSEIRGKCIEIEFPDSLVSLCLSSRNYVGVMVNSPKESKNLRYIECGDDTDKKRASIRFNEYNSLTNFSLLTVFRHSEEETRFALPVVDWSFLSSLQSLQRLQLKSVNLKEEDILSICSLSSLTHLDISSCPSVPDLSPLSKLGRLTHLNTCTMRASKLPSHMNCLLFWEACTNFGHLTQTGTLSFPQLREFSVKGNDLTENSVSVIFSFPCVQHILIEGCGVELEWFTSMATSSSVKTMEIRKSKSLKKYFRRQRMLMSEDASTEKQLSRRVLEGKEGPEVDSQNEEFRPYLIGFFNEAKRRFETTANKLKDSVIVEAVTNHQDFKAKHKGATLWKPLNHIFQNLGNVRPEKEAMKTLLWEISFVLKKNWQYVHKNMLQSLKLIDFIPSNYHKQYLGVQAFLPPVWNVHFDISSLRLERDLFSQAPTLFLLMSAKRANVFLPKAILRFIISFTK